MPPLASCQPTKSKLRYHGHVAILHTQDAKWTAVRKERDLGSSNCDSGLPNEEMFHGCLKSLKNYREKIESNFGLVLNQDSDVPTDPLSSYLYKPLCYHAFHHADTLAIYLADDFDPIHSISAETKFLSEEIDVAFCPDLEALGIDTSESGCFREMSSFFEAGSCLDDLAPSNLQEEAPLLTVSKLKLDGLSVLSQGLLVQEAAIRVIARVVEDVVSRYSRGEFGEYLGEADADSIKRSKFCILDMQGQEELSLVAHTTNLSLVATIVNQIQCMCLEDTFEVHNLIYEDQDFLRCFLGHKKSLQSIVAHELSKPRGPSKRKVDLSRNPLFRWVSTTFYRSHGVDLDSERCSGFVEAQFETHIGCGLQREADSLLRSEVECLNDSAVVLGNVLPTETSLHTLGTTDGILTSGENDRKTLSPLVKVLEVRREMIRSVRRSVQESRLRSVKGLQVRVTVPAPLASMYNGFDVEDKRMPEAMLDQIMPMLSGRIFSGGPPDYWTGEYSDLSDFESLRKITKDIGVPMALRRSVENLYKKYSQFLTDPQMVDMVIDLYDSFHTLFEAIRSPEGVEGLRDSCFVASSKSGSTRYILGQEKVEEFGEIVGALHNAYNSRVSQAYPEEVVRDRSVLFHGRLSQILHAADAPLKCGVGILRRNQIGDAGGYDKVGVNVMMGFQPGVRVTPLKLGDKDGRTLAFLSIDVPHLLHVTTYCDYLHEAFHLVSDQGIRGELGDVDAVDIDRFNEINVHLLTCLFICGNDYASYVNDQLSSVALVLPSKIPDDGRYMADWVENSLRLFTIEFIYIHGRLGGITTAGVEPIGGDIYLLGEQFFSGFREALERSLCYSSEMIRILATDDLQRHFYAYAEEACCEWWSKVVSWLENIETRCLGVVENFTREEILPPRGLTEDLLQAFYDAKSKMLVSANDHLTEGRAFHPGLNEPSRNSRHRDAFGPDMGSNCVLVLTSLLHAYMIRRQNSEKSDALHVRRGTAEKLGLGGQSPVGFDADSVSLYLIDLCSATRFCCVPRARVERLQAQVSIVKSMWGVSTAVRARRLAKLVSHLSPTIVPSLHPVGEGILGKRIDEIEGFCEWVHLDVADGTLTGHQTHESPEELDRLFEIDAFVELHLMCNDPLAWLKAHDRWEWDRVSFHVGPCDDVGQTIEEIHRLLPCTEIGLAFGHLDEMKDYEEAGKAVDMIHIMAKTPGDNSEELILDKVILRIEEAREIFSVQTVEIDGGVVPENIRELWKNGATRFVSGRGYLFQGLTDDLAASREKVYSRLNDFYQ